MFRTVKYLFYMVTLGFAGYLIEAAAVDPFLAMLFAALLITGPEGAETFLVRAGQLDDRSGDDDDPFSDD